MSLQEVVDYTVEESSINGKGVFAKRLIKSGEVIFTWHPKVLTKEEASQLPEDELKHYTYPEGDKILWMQPPERYINHSCEPNTKVDGKSDVATRDIQPRDEVTSDYIDIETEDFVCSCGANSCRGSSRKHNNFILDIPEYQVDGEPDFKVIGKKIDDYIKQEYLGRRIAIRALSSDEHPNFTRDKLIEVIKRDGSDRYDPSREGDRYKNVDNKHIDIFALPLNPLKTEDEMFGHMLDSFYHYPLKTRGKPVKVDIIIIYDLNQLDEVEHQYEGRDEIKKDGFVFKHQDRASSILQIIKVN